MNGRIQDYASVGIVHFMMWKDTIRGEGDHRSVDTVLADPYFGAIEVTWIKNAAERARVAQLVKASGKALAFGGLVGIIGCLRGLQTETGPGAVGQSTTRAVVSSLVALVAAEGVFAVLLYLLDI